MTHKDVVANVEGMLVDRPTKPFRASREEAEVLRTAIALRNGHASGVAPDPWFVDNLHHQLAAIAADPGPPRRRPDRPPLKLECPGRPEAIASKRPPTGRQWWAPIGKAAAAVAVAAASVTATITVGHGSPAPVGQLAPSAVAVRSAALLANDGRALGRAYAYSGNPSWVFMDVRRSGLSGSYVCDLHLTNGTILTAGLVTVYNGTGDWAHTVKIEAGLVSKATLVTPSGAAVASATFS